MKSVISVLGVLFLSASASGAVFDPGHVFWDLTAEQETYTVGDWIPSQDFLGDPLILPSNRLISIRGKPRPRPWRTGPTRTRAKRCLARPFCCEEILATPAMDRKHTYY